MLWFLLMVEIMVVLAINVFSPSQPFLSLQVFLFFLFLSFLLFLFLFHLLFNPFFLTIVGFRQKKTGLLWLLLVLKMMVELAMNISFLLLLFFLNVFEYFLVPLRVTMLFLLPFCISIFI